MPDPLRLGLIGAGRWGRNYIRTIAKLQDVRLARLASRNPESAALVPADCLIVSKWRELMDRSTVDGIIVATPPATHAEMAAAAVLEGLPVLIEKPLALSLAEARTLRDLALQRGALAMVDHTHLFHPAYRALKAMASRFGAILGIETEAGSTGPYRQDTPVLWDWGAHDVAMCLDLLGAMPERAAARTVERVPMSGAQGEIVEISLTFPGEVRATMRVGNMIPKRRSFSVRCEGAILVYDDQAPHKLVVIDRGRISAPQPVEIAADQPLAVAVREFANAINAGSSDRASLKLGVDVVEVLAACAGTLA